MSTRLRIALFAFATLLSASLGAAPASAATRFLEKIFAQPQQLHAPAFQRYEAPDIAQPLNFRQDEVTIRKAKRLRQLQAQRRKIQKAKHLAKARERQKAPALTLATPKSAPAIIPPATAEEAIVKVLQDDTLRPGDAYMASDGLRVFVGVQKKTSTSRNHFVPVARARDISPALRARLVALERKPVMNAPAIQTAKARTAGRPPVQLAMNQVPERYITDARGRTIRLVGEAFFAGIAPATTSALPPDPQHGTQLAQR